MKFLYINLIQSVIISNCQCVLNLIDMDHLMVELEPEGSRDANGDG